MTGRRAPYSRARTPKVRHNRSAMTAMLAGLALTIVALFAPYLDRDGIVSHIRAGYPSYSAARIDTAADTYVIYLTIVGVLGVLCWLAAMWAVTTGMRWARWATAGTFALATTVALTDLLIRDTSGDTGLPPLLGWIGLLPCLAGLVAVGLLLRRRHADPKDD